MGIGVSPGIACGAVKILRAAQFDPSQFTYLGESIEIERFKKAQKILSHRLKLLHEKTKVSVAEYIRQGIDLLLEKQRHHLPGQLTLEVPRGR